MTVKNILHWVLAATLICGASVFTACTKGNGDGPGDARKKALLIILDGWGIGDKGQDDVAPSILHIMGLEQPEEMTGRSLLSKK